MKHLITLLAGLLFGLGLRVSQMLNPQKVINFLDITGNWDASLAFVMAGALLVFSLGYYFLIKPSSQPLIADKYFMPSAKIIDKPLVVGAIIFGLGWGLVGICPGPALANILGGDVKILGFIAAMLIGMKMSGLLAAVLSPNSSKQGVSQLD